MHNESYRLMSQSLNKVKSDKKLKVLDVGSYDVNGTFRPLVEDRKWEYTGLDVVEGPNVDIVSEEEFNFPVKDNEYDIVISGSTMEHVTAIWEWVPELVRVLKPEGLLVVHTMWRYSEHKYPKDCWRVLPDGMEYLFNATGELENYNIRMVGNNVIATANKKKTVAKTKPVKQEKEIKEKEDV